MDVGLAFDWDAENTRHLSRHGVTPSEFEQLMGGDPIYLEYQMANGEERYKVLGATGAGDADRHMDAARGQGPGSDSPPRGPRASRAVLENPGVKQERMIPTFQSEAEEADWWFDNRERLDSDLLEPAESGAKRLDRATLGAILARSEAGVVSIRLPEADIELAREQAALKGLPYQTYLKSLLHKLLQEAK